MGPSGGSQLVTGTEGPVSTWSPVSRFSDLNRVAAFVSSRYEHASRTTTTAGNFTRHHKPGNTGDLFPFVAPVAFQSCKNKNLWLFRANQNCTLDAHVIFLRRLIKSRGRGCLLFASNDSGKDSVSSRKAAVLLSARITQKIWTAGTRTHNWRKTSRLS